MAEHHHTFISSHWKEILELLSTNQISIHSNAASKKNTLRFLKLLVTFISAEQLKLITTVILPQALLCTKDYNPVVRLQSFKTFKVLGDQWISQFSFEQFVGLISAGLGGQTPQMISATLSVIANLVFDFFEQISPEFAAKLMTPALTLLETHTKEIVKEAIKVLSIATFVLNKEQQSCFVKEIVFNFKNSNF